MSSSNSTTLRKVCTFISNNELLIWSILQGKHFGMYFLFEIILFFVSLNEIHHCSLELDWNVLILKWKLIHFNLI